ncbi:MAG TPA: nicotinate-nicotinamide nucleotide adenylyltransferase [Candidatus Binatia bacterium]|jgi:nicotinate-nucleotide adenylyltransferase|nr:nicotinate-nicotinamide nucleotide adenylyltransferase [Candidatus Binatia bacterium]
MTDKETNINAVAHKPRIGLFPGTFDPVHTGHMVFAIKALKEAKLDALYFLPERRPRSKPEVTHFGHRTAMLTRAIRPYTNLGVLELPDMYFDVKRTLPKLQKEFAGSELVFLLGSDTVLKMNQTNWPAEDLQTFLGQTSLVIGLRSNRKRRELNDALKNLPVQPKSLQILELPTRHLSSSRIRNSFRRGQKADGLLASVQAYARSNWLYISLAGE